MLRVENLSKTYKERFNVLVNMNFEICSGTICGIVGEKGAGKSVLLKILSGRSDKSAGEVYLDCKSIRKKLFKKPKGITYISNHSNVVPFITGKMYLWIIARKYHASFVLLRDLYQKFNECFGLDCIDCFIYNYSTEMRIILAVFGAILKGEKVIILDEPFLDMSKQTRSMCKELLIKIKNKGSIVIVASEKMEQEKFYSKVIILKYGVIIIDQNITSFKEYQDLKKLFEGRYVKNKN